MCFIIFALANYICSCQWLPQAYMGCKWHFWPLHTHTWTYLNEVLKLLWFGGRVKLQNQLKMLIYHFYLTNVSRTNCFHLQSFSNTSLVEVIFIHDMKWCPIDCMGQLTMPSLYCIPCCPSLSLTNCPMSMLPQSILPQLSVLHQPILP